MVIRQRFVRTKESGSSVVEFAMVALIFFTLIFAIIEFGRLLYTHNALADATRRAARYAVLHAKNDTCVRNVAIYGESHITARPDCDPTGPELVNGLADATITTEYDGFDHDGIPGTPGVYGSNLGRVTVTITNYTFDLSIPGIGRQLTLSDYVTSLETESAGEEPGVIGAPPP